MFGLSMPEAYTCIFQTCRLHRNPIIWYVRSICTVIKRRFLPARPQVYAAYKQNSEWISENGSLCINTDTNININNEKCRSQMLKMHYSSHHALGDVNREVTPLNERSMKPSAFSIHVLFPSFQSVVWCYKNVKWCHELLLRGLWLQMTSLARDGRAGIWDVLYRGRNKDTSSFLIDLNGLLEISMEDGADLDKGNRCNNFFSLSTHIIAHFQVHTFSFCVSSFSIHSLSEDVPFWCLSL